MKHDNYISIKTNDWELKLCINRCPAATLALDVGPATPARPPKAARRPGHSGSWRECGGVARLWPESRNSVQLRPREFIVSHLPPGTVPARHTHTETEALEG